MKLTTLCCMHRLGSSGERERTKYVYALSAHISFLYTSPSLLSLMFVQLHCMAPLHGSFPLPACLHLKCLVVTHSIVFDMTLCFVEKCTLPHTSYQN